MDTKREKAIAEYFAKKGGGKVATGEAETTPAQNDEQHMDFSTAPSKSSKSWSSSSPRLLAVTRSFENAGSIRQDVAADGGTGSQGEKPGKFIHVLATLVDCTLIGSQLGKGAAACGPSDATAARNLLYSDIGCGKTSIGED